MSVNAKGQGHSLTLALVTLIAGPSTFQRAFSLKRLGEFQLNFIYSLPGNR